MIYLWFLIAGFLLHSAEGVQASIQRLRWLSLGMGIVLLAGVIGFLAMQGIPEYGTPFYPIALGIAGLSSWCWILAFFGLAMRYLNFRKPVLDTPTKPCCPSTSCTRPCCVCLKAWSMHVTAALLRQLDYHGRYERRARENVVQKLMRLT